MGLGSVVTIAVVMAVLVPLFPDQQCLVSAVHWTFTRVTHLARPRLGWAGRMLPALGLTWNRIDSGALFRF